METTKKQRDGFAALAAWRLRPLPRASDDLRPFPDAEIGNDEFLQAVCRDVDTLEEALGGLLSFVGLDTVPCQACVPGDAREDCPPCQARAVLAPKP